MKSFVARKFGNGRGATILRVPDRGGTQPRSKRSVSSYSDEVHSLCMGEVASYIHEKFGKFPGTFTTVVLTGFVQAVHLDTDFYDKHYGTGAYLDSHTEHMKRWHSTDHFLTQQSGNR